MRTLVRIFTLIAVLLMPLGMTAPAAEAAHHRMAASMPIGHCTEQAPTHSGKAGFAECTMACSSALPAADFHRAEPARIVCVPDRPAVAQRLRGLHPETATPPPKRS